MTQAQVQAARAVLEAQIRAILTDWSGLKITHGPFVAVSGTFGGVQYAAADASGAAAANRLKTLVQAQD